MPSLQQKLDLPNSITKTLLQLYLKQQIISEDAPWTLVSGVIYSADFDFGSFDGTCRAWQGDPINTGLSVDFQADANELQQVDTMLDIILDGQWSFDNDLKKVYIRINPTILGTDPNDADFTFEFMLFASSHWQYYLRQPSSLVSDEVEYPGCIARAPIFKQSFDSQLFGFLPVETSQIVLRNEDGFFNKYLYSSVWKNARFQLWNDFLKDESQTESYLLTMRGIVDIVSADDGQISISVRSFLDFLDKVYPIKTFAEHGAGFTSIATSDQGKYVRKMFGKVEGAIPINVNQNDTVSTTTNRDWVFSQDPIASHPSVNLTVDTAFANTAILTKVTTIPTGVGNRDSIKLLVSGVPYYVHVGLVDYTNKLIHHSDIGVARTSAPGDTVTRGFLSRFQFLDNGPPQFYPLYKGVHYNEMDFDGCAGIRLVDNVESILTITPGYTFDPKSMFLVGDVYGVKSLAQLSGGGGSLGAVSQRWGSYANPVGVLLSILVESGRSDGTDQLIDNASFISEFAIDDYVGFAIPESSSGSAPKIRDVVVRLLNSFLGRLFLKETSAGPLFSVNRVAPTKVTPDFVLDSTEIIPTVQQDIDYRDAPSKLNLNFGYSEGLLAGEAPPVSAEYLPDNSYDKGSIVFPAPNDNLRTIFKNGKQARWSYFTTNVIEFGTFLAIDYTQASVDQINSMANRLSWLMNERRNKITISVKNRFILANIGDTIEVQRDFLPGFEYLFGEENSRKFILVEKQQSEYGVILILDDQKGVEDHSGSW